MLKSLGEGVVGPAAGEDIAKGYRAVTGVFGGGVGAPSANGENDTALMSHVRSIYPVNTTHAV